MESQVDMVDRQTDLVGSSVRLTVCYWSDLNGFELVLPCDD